MIIMHVHHAWNEFSQFGNPLNQKFQLCCIYIHHIMIAEHMHLF